MTPLATYIIVKELKTKYEDSSNALKDHMAKLVWVGKSEKVDVYLHTIECIDELIQDMDNLIEKIKQE